jgi:hypothetical protein
MARKMTAAPAAESADPANQDEIVTLVHAGLQALPAINRSLAKCTSRCFIEFFIGHPQPKHPHTAIQVLGLIALRVGSFLLFSITYHLISNITLWMPFVAVDSSGIVILMPHP